MRATTILAFLAIMYVLQAGSSIFIPFFMAAFIWLLIFMMSGAMSARLHKWGAPKFAFYISRTVAIIAIAGGAWVITSIIAHQSTAVVGGFERYMPNINYFIGSINDRYGLDLDIASVMASIDMKRIAATVFQQSAGIMQSFFMVLLYLVFMLLEEQSMKKKLPLLFKDKKQFDKKMIENIIVNIRTYLLVKTWASLATGLLGFLLMLYFGIDFALFFGMLLFVGNYIPFVGSIIASILPVLLAILQFPDSLAPAVGLGIGLFAIQMAVGQLWEPRYLGNSVGVSPLVLLLSLVIFGWIWGIAGMFLCVPIMIIVNIVLSNIPSTKKLSILLSHEGGKE
ncbi:MAG: AI-2E family transporter [Alphaproteobacteria bacterium]|nr:AI-2E family transporter [Alphaproteobacteria bacterium]